MEGLKLTWTITKRMIACGGAGGGILGLIYSGLLFSIAGSSYLAPLACTVGFAVGGLLGLILNGLLLTLITYLALRDPENRGRYKAFACIASVILTGFAGLLGFAGFTSSLGFISDEGWLFYTVIPTLIAVCFACIATFNVASWFEWVSSLSEPSSPPNRIS